MNQDANIHLLYFGLPLLFSWTVGLLVASWTNKGKRAEFYTPTNAILYTIKY